MRLRSITKLADELEKTPDVCTQILAAKGIYVIDGYYDAALFEAAVQEPRIPAKQRVEWGLSPRLGLGAVKAILDPLRVRIVIHDPKGPQWLMLRKGVQTAYVKWQYANASGKQTNVCNFEVRNFLTEKAPQHYLFTCFEGPFAWAIPAKAMVAAWNTLQKGEPVDKFQIAKNQEKHVGGALALRLHTTQSKFELKDAKQLGF